MVVGVVRAIKPCKWGKLIAGDTRIDRYSCEQAFQLRVQLNISAFEVVVAMLYTSSGIQPASDNDFSSGDSVVHG
jgi:hypothetical protein